MDQGAAGGHAERGRDAGGADVGGGVLDPRGEGDARRGGVEVVDHEEVPRGAGRNDLGQAAEGQGPDGAGVSLSRQEQRVAAGHHAIAVVEVERGRADVGDLVARPAPAEHDLGHADRLGRPGRQGELNHGDVGRVPESIAGARVVGAGGGAQGALDERVEPTGHGPAGRGDRGRRADADGADVCRWALDPRSEVLADRTGPVVGVGHEQAAGRAGGDHEGQAGEGQGPVVGEVGLPGQEERVATGHDAVAVVEVERGAREVGQLVAGSAPVDHDLGHLDRLGRPRDEVQLELGDVVGVAEAGAGARVVRTRVDRQGAEVDPLDAAGDGGAAPGRGDG